MMSTNTHRSLLTTILLYLFSILQLSCFSHTPLSSLAYTNQTGDRARAASYLLAQCQQDQDHRYENNSIQRRRPTAWSLNTQPSKICRISGRCLASTATGAGTTARDRRPRMGVGFRMAERRGTVDLLRPAALEGSTGRRIINLTLRISTRHRARG
ncbi:unnamed protein product, partial [Ectocarpus sp. 12 AP-2014]